MIVYLLLLYHGGAELGDISWFLCATFSYRDVCHSIPFWLCSVVFFAGSAWLTFFWQLCALPVLFRYLHYDIFAKESGQKRFHPGKPDAQFSWNPVVSSCGLYCSRACRGQRYKKPPQSSSNRKCRGKKLYKYCKINLENRTNYVDRRWNKNWVNEGKEE